MTELTVLVSIILGVVYYFLIPDRYFVLFPVLPVYFYLSGLFSIYMFSVGYQIGEHKLVSMFLINKVIKFIVNILFVVIYCFAVNNEILSFFSAFVVYYITFLIFETSFFFKTEIILKRKKKNKQ